MINNHFTELINEISFPKLKKNYHIMLRDSIASKNTNAAYGGGT